MGWIDKPHRCDVPLICHESTGKVRDWYECDHCHKEWQVQARVLIDEYRNYGMTFVRREGGKIITLSWQEAV